MFENLEVFSRRLEELNVRLCEPATASDPALYAQLMKEYGELEPLVVHYRQYCAAEKDRSEAQEILADSASRDLHGLAQQQLKEAEQKLVQLTEKIKILLLPKDPNDDKNVIVEIRGGAGGEEAALFSAVLYRMYTMYVQNRGWQTELLNVNETELGGYKEISFMVTGAGAWSRLKYESGVHRVQRVPETEAQGRIHTSTATVAVLPEADEVEVQIDPKDLQIDTYRSSGAGGQHINKTSSAIRITHLPTGLVVECQDERSQYKNKDKAMRVLRSRLLHMEQQKHDDAIASERRSQVGSGDRSERIRTYNYPQGRVTDHRIGLTIYRLEDVLNGALDQIIDPLIAADRAQQMKQTMNDESD
ncbi:MAG: peptide chain release factor 1 [Oscillospiraceae bacterium]|jgi:peptide chain release factor 1|nr:peptide chain release factor 1 [Oscillospiraceae bacterium]